jgi:hypothetical protein
LLVSILPAPIHGRLTALSAATAFTVEGIFTYDSNIGLRFEIQVEGEHPEDAAAERDH